MKLTAFTDYSLRVLIFLAADPARRATIGEIAETFGVSQNHLVKVVHFLGRRGWVATVRGRGGGIVLALHPRQINVGQVVRDTEGAVVPAECFDEGAAGRCILEGCCRLQNVLGEAVGLFYAALDRYTLEDITGNRQQLRQVLHLRAGN